MIILLQTTTTNNTNIIVNECIVMIYYNILQCVLSSYLNNDHIVCQDHVSIYADMMELVIIHATKELRYVVIVVISATKK